jgi:hypothetical protein
MMGMPSRFASEEWRTIPFGEQGKSLLHQLVDIILFIPLFLVQVGYFGPMDGTVRKIATSDTLPIGLERNYGRLEVQLEKWWEAYKSSDPEESEMLFTMTGPEPQEYKKVPGVQYSPTLFLQRDSVTAFTVSLYNATSLIVHTILHALSIVSERLGQRSPHPGKANYHLKQAIIHSNSILDISSHQQEKKPNGMDFMRTMFPLRIVYLFSPPEQSTKAHNLIKQFHVINAMSKSTGPAVGHNQNVGPPHATALRIAAIQNKLDG